MNAFEPKAQKLLIEFRQSFKHSWSKQLIAQFPISNICLDRRYLRTLNDLGLYENVVYLSELIQAYITQHPNLHHQDHTMCEYLQELDTMINAYTINEYKVIHKQEHAAHAYVQAIQLINLPAEKLDEHTSKQLKKYLTCVAEYGSPKHIKHLIECLKKQQYKNNYFFLIQIRHFKSILSSK